MHLRAVCDVLATLGHEDASKLYDRARRLVDHGLIRRGVKGYGIDLTEVEVARALIAAFLPASGPALIEKVEKLANAREYRLSENGPLVATGSPVTFEQMLAQAIGAEGGDIQEILIVAAGPLAEVEQRDGARAIFSAAAGGRYSKGRRLMLGGAILPCVIVTRGALVDLGRALKGGA